MKNELIQIRNFENNSFFQLAVQLRKFDDIGKNPEYQDVDFSYYFPLLKSLNQNYKK